MCVLLSSQEVAYSEVNFQSYSTQISGRKVEWFGYITQVPPDSIPVRFPQFSLIPAAGLGHIHYPLYSIHTGIHTENGLKQRGCPR